jgi:hypothetical protein
MTVTYPPKQVLSGGDMLECDFQMSDGLWKCKWCNAVYPKPVLKPPRCDCPKSPDLQDPARYLGIPPKELPLYDHLLRAWIIAGKPERTPEEQGEILELCDQCDLSGGGECNATCRGCKKKGPAPALKLSVLVRMATAHCRDENPRW